MSRANVLRGMLEKGKNTEKQKNELDMNWSPNNVRMVLVTQNAVWVVYYTSSTGKKFETSKLEKAEPDERSILAPLFGKSGGITYSALEAVVFLVTEEYRNGSWQTDASEYFNKLRVKDSELLGSFPRLRAYTSIYCKTLQDYQQVMSEIRTAISTNVDFTETPAYKQRLLVKNSLSDLHKDTWWQAGIYDDKIPDAKKRLLRPWLYAKDYIPTETTSAGPIYKALRHVSQPYIDKIEAKKKEERKQEEKKKEAEQTSKLIEKDRELIIKNASKYVNGYASLSLVLQSAQTERLNVSKRRIDVSNALHAKLHFTTEEINRYNDISIYALSVGEKAWKVISPNAQHTWGYMLAKSQSQYLYNITAGTPMQDGMAEMFKGFLRYYYASNFAITKDDGVKSMLCAFVTNDADRPKAMANLQRYLGCLRWNKYPAMQEEEITEPIILRASDYLKMFDTMLYTELALAYISFIKLLPYWYQDSQNYLNELTCVILCEQAGFNTFDDPLIRYDKTMKDIIQPIVTGIPDWDKKFTNMKCTKWFENGTSLRTVQEYHKHIQGVYKAINYLIDNILE